MRAVEIGFGSVWRVGLSVFEDTRGHFFECISDRHLNLVPHLKFVPVQSNVSVSTKGALRGIHYSLATGGQSKWVTCLAGSILDCVVDLRVGSPTFGQSKMLRLSSEIPEAIYIGPGIGHAFLSLEDESIVNYLLDSKYDPSQEFALNAFDPTLGIDWPVMKYILSKKDSEAMDLQDLNALHQLPNYEYS
jgi:dTDP-4-dehydrorhamnose 3,5-epimerase